MHNALRTLLPLLLFFASPSEGADRSRPNIIVILADDMGYSDIGCYGGEVATPNIDRLAKKGLRYTQFYNTARCCPTRASLLTGLYPHQAGVPHMVDNQRLPLEQRQLKPNVDTIAESLRAGGYHTAMSGKWHVCPVTSYQTNGPMARGFERFYGLIHGAASYYAPVTLMRDHETITNVPPNYFLTDAIANSASDYIRDFSAEQKPFFLYVAFTAPHWPLHAPEEDARKYLPKYERGWDLLREERHKRMIDLGIIGKNTPLSPRDADSRPWTQVTNKQWQAHRMAVYAAQIERMDRGIGRILKTLEEKSELDNTIIFFLADNGGCAEPLGPNMKALHVPPHAPDGGPMRLGNSPEIFPGGPDTYASYGLPWANLSNTPFRTYKHWVHEGGISTPLIIHWPNGITKPGLRLDPGHLIDIMATCVDLADAKSSKQKLEGKSLKSTFSNGHLKDRPIFFEHEGNRAVRSGNWKLVSRYPSDWELYDLSKDRSELNNVADKNPRVVKRLQEEYEAWAERAGVPKPELVATQPARRN